MTSLAQALEWLATHITPPSPRTVPPQAALDHTLATPCPIHLTPPHPIAALHGHAVRALDTQGASDYAPLPLASTPVQPGDPLPPGTDAVLLPTQLEQGCATAPCAPGENVIPPGRDSGPPSLDRDSGPPQYHGDNGPAEHHRHISPAPLPAGTWLRPLHIPLLATHPTIHPLPSIALRHPTPLLLALCATLGLPPTLTSAPNLSLTTAPPPLDAPIRSIAIHPGEPTALGHLDTSPSGPTPAIFLPRLPEDCAAAFDLLVRPTLLRLLNRPPPPTFHATLSRKITSPLGITSAVRLSLRNGIATPLPPGLPAATANALTLIPEPSEGYPEGATIPISLLP